MNFPMFQVRTFVLATAFLAPASTPEAQAPASECWAAMDLRIQTERSTYKVGEPIRVRVTLRNMSGHRVETILEITPPLPPCEFLTVQGEPSTRTIPGVPGRLRGPALRMDAGTEVILRGPDRTSWINLQDWGYSLQEPGRYEISGFTEAIGWTPNPTVPESSNRVEFSITPRTWLDKLRSMFES